MEGLSPKDWLQFGALGLLGMMMMLLMRLLATAFSKMTDALTATAAANQAVADRLERIEDQGCANKKILGGAP